MRLEGLAALWLHRQRQDATRWPIQATSPVPSESMAAPAPVRWNGCSRRSSYLRPRLHQACTSTCSSSFVSAYVHPLHPSPIEASSAHPHLAHPPVPLPPLTHRAGALPRRPAQPPRPNADAQRSCATARSRDASYAGWT
ncbi:hypothetical protein PENSPDRAFT_361349 [Peniophora sp. CONT]|nr:hypothetical protein PENSPDRAFT_361349 [Peniophora sp. CONT]